MEQIHAFFAVPAAPTASSQGKSPVRRSRADPLRPSLRSLAAQLKLSVATVSEALRDSPRISPDTAARVRAAAKAAGYQSNPVVGAVMSSVRRRAHVDYQGTIAAINYSETANTKLIPFHAQLLAGARERAQQLGFKMDLFWFGPRLMPLSRLNAILHSRGIQGVFALHFTEAADLTGLDWSRRAGVSMDYGLNHSVMLDHHTSIFHALDELRRRGYRRPGLALVREKDERMMFKWSAGFFAHSLAQQIKGGVPPLMLSELTAEKLLPWVRRYKPDVILGHRAEIIQWLSAAGLRVPKDVGFFNLNWNERTAPCAGLDLNPMRQGAAAVESLIAQLHRNDLGLPDHAKTISTVAVFTEGPTIRPLPARPA